MPCNTKAPTIRWFYLTIGILSMLFAGILYSWSILKAPLADAFGWNASQLTMNFTLTMCFSVWAEWAAVCWPGGWVPA